MFLAFSNIVVQVVYCFFEEEKQKNGEKKKFNVPLWFEFPVFFLFGSLDFSVQHFEIIN